jgi:hypothetical protein
MTVWSPYVAFCRGPFPIIGVSSVCFSNLQRSETQNEVINFMLLKKMFISMLSCHLVTQNPWGRLEIKYAFRCD